MSSAVPIHAPVAPRRTERRALEELGTQLARRRGRARLLGPGQHETALPESVYAILREAVRQLRDGNAVALLPVTTELTTREAADLLNVAPAHVTDLVERGEIPHRTVSGRRRVLVRDVLAYKARHDARARRALQGLVDFAQRHDLYFE